jgi:hypothetical protein
MAERGPLIEEQGYEKDWGDWKSLTCFVAIPYYIDELQFTDHHRVCSIREHHNDLYSSNFIRKLKSIC